MEIFLLSNLTKSCQRVWWTRRLRQAICKNDLEGAKTALSRGARVDGWKAKSPYMGQSVHAPPMRFTAQGPLNLAFHWLGKPEMFQLLLGHGAQVDRFRYTVGEMRQRAAFLDSFDRNTRHKNWVGRFGPAIEQMCEAFSTRQALEDTVEASGSGATRRL